MRNQPANPRRARLAYACWMLTVICAGLLLRSGKLPLDSWCVKYGGDALWALVVFLGLGFAWPTGSPYRVAGVAVCLSWTVEFLQLYHAHWIDVIRGTTIGRLVLGHTFNPPDLAAYVVGVLLGLVAELVHSQCRQRGLRST